MEQTKIKIREIESMKFRINQVKNSYIISFSYKGKQIRFYPGTDDLKIAEKVKEQMVYEWNQGIFDENLERYKLKNKNKINIRKNNKLISIFTEWVRFLNLKPETFNNHYHSLLQRIEKENPNWDDVSWFLEQYKNSSSYTFNSRLGFLISCIDWAINSELISGNNPYKLIRKKEKEIKSNIKPFGKKEVLSIIEAFESDYPYYSGYVKFQFLTGARPGETIAIRKSDINFEANKILINKAYSRDLASGIGKEKKILKKTKTGESGFIPISELLKAVLIEQLNQIENINSELLFPGMKGGIFDIRNFRKIWKRVLSDLKIEYRYPYQCRHTALSEVAISQGLLAASKLARHRNTRMVAENYGRYLDDVKLPTYL